MFATLSSVGAFGTVRGRGLMSRRLAAVSINTADTSVPEGFASALERKKRPAHIGLHRRRLELTFAVRLMRASYNAMDRLNCTATDEFQRNFFPFRQSE